ncbi:DUF995 domain-containing protein [Microvirga terrae]|uniref:DUF995 domain-containing protein n=1 Tax=Microvirga terrae TaxID=2740529 RepID=A0ABY5RMH9_9HYPH|nr:DUF995 domain-containing protein [Microvirga terrae]UVF18440.1 DUF995 domain-containing protein [Microvirga terrae]
MRHQLGFSHLRKLMILGVVCLSGIATAGAADAKPTKGAASEAPGGRPMTAAELRKLYGGKTWLWSNGGGYMDPSGRFYAAVGTKRATGSLARGTWATDGKGRMCFEGRWKTQTGSNSARTCFTHYVNGAEIYQRRAPRGAWYVFKHAEAQQNDEFNKIVTGNRIAEQFGQIRAALASR